MKRRISAAGLAILATIAALSPVFGSLSKVYASAAATQASQDPNEGKVVETVEFQGNRRIPDDSIRLWVQTREGDPYSPDQIRRDLRTILAQGFFEDAKVFVDDGPRGGLVVIFEMREYPIILDLDYPGLKSVSQSELLEEWRKQSVGLSKESQLDPIKANRAAQVIRDMLSIKGHPDAVVKWEAEEISATGVFLHFNVTEGDRVRVAHIEFDGNTVFSDGELRDQMKFVKQNGLISGLTSKDVYAKEKLEADLEHVRFYYADHGYINAKLGEPIVEEAGRVGSGIPLIGGKSKGLKVTIPVDEGRQYTVGTVTVEGATVYPEDVIKRVIGIEPGEILKASEIREGVFENLKKLYGERGYIQFEPGFIPDLKDDPNDPKRGVADVTFQLTEGKSFSVHRIEFKGNTYTRDNVLRREVLVNEGDPYNQRYWDLSILRLNQLGYFNEIKDTDADIRTNDQKGEVDIDLRVQEKGRQQIQFTGGVSGIGGSFVGIQYSTNNLLGYGESLSFDVSAGNRSNYVSFSFSEPYLLGRPISAGFSLFYSKLQYFGNAVQVQSSGLAGIPSGVFNANFNTINTDQLFTQTTVGGSVSVSAPLAYFFKQSTSARFARVGLSYTLRNNSITDPPVNTDDDPTNDLLVTFRETGIKQSTVTPTFTFNSTNAALDPTRGMELSGGMSFSGGFLGGDVNTIQGTAEFKYYHPFNIITRNPEKPDVFAFRVLAGHIRAFGERVDTNSLSFVGGTPIFSRYFLGGEDTLRGYNVRAVSPVALIQQFSTTQNEYAVDAGGDRYRVLPPNLANRRSIAPGPIRRFTNENELNGIALTSIGGDTNLLANVEYRVPIVGPVSIAGFFDIGSAFNLNTYEDQTQETAFIPQVLSPFFIINPVGQIATQKEIQDATTPETPPGGLPKGFRLAQVRGDQMTTRIYRLAGDAGDLFSNYRYSVGAELRVQVPVINVPFRLIFAYNPNARTDVRAIDQFPEERKVFRFSVGRTF
jgi:outer membrane protein insertion porin family